MSTTTASTPSGRRPQLESKNKSYGWGWPRLVDRSAAQSTASSKADSRSRSDSDPSPRITVEVSTKRRPMPERVNEDQEANEAGSGTKEMTTSKFDALKQAPSNELVPDESVKQTGPSMKTNTAGGDSTDVVETKQSTKGEEVARWVDTTNPDSASDTATIRQPDAAKETSFRGKRDVSSEAETAQGYDTADEMVTTATSVEATEDRSTHTDNEADDEAGEDSDASASDAEILQASPHELRKPPKLIIRIPTTKGSSSPTPYPGTKGPEPAGATSEEKDPSASSKTPATAKALSPVIELMPVKTSAVSKETPTIELLSTIPPGQEPESDNDAPTPKATKGDLSESCGESPHTKSQTQTKLPPPRIFLTRATEDTSNEPFPTPAAPSSADYMSASPLPSEIQTVLNSEPAPVLPARPTHASTALINEEFGHLDVPVQAKRRVRRRKRVIRRTRKVVLRTPVLKVLLGRQLAATTRPILVVIAEAETEAMLGVVEAGDGEVVTELAMEVVPAEKVKEKKVKFEKMDGKRRSVSVVPKTVAGVPA